MKVGRGERSEQKRRTGRRARKAPCVGTSRGSEGRKGVCRSGLMPLLFVVDGREKGVEYGRGKG